jgi:hypothetical protein
MKNEVEKPSYQEMCGLPSWRSKSGLDARWCMKKIRATAGRRKKKNKRRILDWSNLVRGTIGKKSTHSSKRKRSIKGHISVLGKEEAIFSQSLCRTKTTQTIIWSKITSKRNPKLWDLKLARGKGGGLTVIASTTERRWRMASRWVRARLDAIRADEPHRCSTKLEVAWVKKRWTEGQSWHKGTGGGGSSDSWVGAAHAREMKRGATGAANVG